MAHCLTRKGARPLGHTAGHTAVGTRRPQGLLSVRLRCWLSRHADPEARGEKPGLMDKTDMARPPRQAPRFRDCGGLLSDISEYI